MGTSRLSSGMAGSHTPSPVTASSSTQLAPSQRWLDMAFATAYLGLTERTIRRYIAGGKLKAARIGREIRFRLADLDQLAQPISSTESDVGLDDFINGATRRGSAS